MEIYAVTHKGKVRKQNEDSIYIEREKIPYILMVADGMGGHEAGQVASAQAVAMLRARLEQADRAALTPRMLQEMVEETSHALWKMAEADPALHDMGTTLTVALLHPRRVVAAHVGDSRAYLFRDGKLTQMTRDHSYVQFLVDKGILSPEEAESHPYRNIITRAVGMESVEADAYSSTIAPGDSLLLCSDGLTTHVKDEEIAACLQGSKSVEKKGKELLNLALERGGRDNISIILAYHGGGDGE